MNLTDVFLAMGGLMFITGIVVSFFSPRNGSAVFAVSIAFEGNIIMLTGFAFLRNQTEGQVYIILITLITLSFLLMGLSTWMLHKKNIPPGCKEESHDIKYDS